MATLDKQFVPWLQSLGLHVKQTTPLAGDVSPRMYFRVECEEDRSLILAAYPPSARGAFHRFLTTTGLFEKAGIRVPKIHGSSPRLGFMLLEDLGSVSVFDRTTDSWDNLRPYMDSAIESLGSLAALPAAPFAEVNPVLDVHRLAGELREARTVFLDLDEFSADAPSRGALEAALARLMARLALDPLVPSHRDFMSRNLMLPPGESGAAVIDHQDSCLAPRFYDLASLLNDSFFPTRSQEDEILEALTLGEGQIESYRRCAVQRTLKATATYVKFALRGFDRHLALIPPTLSRTASQLELLPEGQGVPESLFALWRDPVAITGGIDGLLARAGETPEARC